MHRQRKLRPGTKVGERTLVLPELRSPPPDYAEDHQSSCRALTQPSRRSRNDRATEGRCWSPPLSRRDQTARCQRIFGCPNRSPSCLSSSAAGTRPRPRPTALAGSRTSPDGRSVRPSPQVCARLPCERPDRRRSAPLNPGAAAMRCPYFKPSTPVAGNSSDDILPQTRQE